VAYSQAALSTELTADPKALGFAPLIAADSPEEIAARLNEPGRTAETLFRDYTPAADIVAAVVKAEYDALNATNKAWLNFLVSASTVRSGDATVRATVVGLFAAGAASIARLQAVSSRPASRAEILFGPGVTVNAVQVQQALGRPGA
jgi:hypothetical protein